MNIHQKYRLVDALPDRLGDRDLSLKGIEITSGRAITIHLLAKSNRSENTALLRELNALRGEERQQILGAGEFNGAAYVVTGELPGNPMLREWVASLKPAITGAGPGAGPEPEADEGPGEFTRIFGKMGKAGAAPVSPSLEQPGTSRTAPPPVNLEPENRDEPAPGPGEFTALFGSALKPASPTGSPAAPGIGGTGASASPVEAADSGPGEFTKLFGGQPAAPERAPGAPGSPLFPQRQPLSAPVAPPIPAEAAEPSEFTKILQSPRGRSGPRKVVPPPQPPAPASPAREPDGFTKMLDSPLISHGFAGQAAKPAPLSIPQSGSDPGPAAPVMGEDEYEKMFKAPRKQPAAAPAPAPKKPAKAPPPRRRKKASMWPLVLAVTFGIVALLGLVMLFALRG